jgi:hypothetical protein
MASNLKTIVKAFDRKLSCLAFGSTIGTYPYLKGLIPWQQYLLKSELILGFEKFRLLRSRDSLVQILHHHRNNLIESSFGPSNPKFVESYDSSQIQECSNNQIYHVCQVLEEIDQRFRPYPSKLRQAVQQVNIYTIQNTTDLRKLSADWHQDRRPVNWLRIFILLHDTQVQHGPLNYIDQQSSYSLIKRGFRRGHIIDDSLPTPIHLLTGSIGDALIINTETCIHRAGVPVTGLARTVMEIVFSV